MISLSADCELLEDFDPLLQPPSSNVSTPSPSTLLADNDIELVVTNPSPTSSPPQPRNSPFHSTDDVNPFSPSSPSQRNSPAEFPPAIRDSKLMKHCISDTNLHQLKQECRPGGGHMESPLVTRSEEDLTATVGEREASPRHCVAKPPLPHNARTTSSPSIGRKLHGEDDRLSRSLFFVKLEENEWATFDDGYTMSDLPARNVRSQDTSPTQHRRGVLKHGSKHKLEFLNPSGIKAITSKANMHSPELSGRHNRKGLSRSRERSKSAAIPSLGVSKCSQWVNRYRPGVAVPIPGETARESIMQSELRHREKEFCAPVKLR